MAETRTASPALDIPFAAIQGADKFPALIGHSHAFYRLRDAVLRALGSDTPVLISGERGTGKSSVAKVLHSISSRGPQPFMTVACSAFPEALLETELFGCVKGGAPGASCDRAGVFEIASGGTVVLEDVEALSWGAQGLLLRVLESGEVHRFGAAGAGRPVKACILASTSAQLRDQVEQGRFLEELWFRLAARQLTVPSLRDRRDDISVLADYFAREFVTASGHPRVVFSAEAHRALQNYSWPGNVRELRNVVERLVASVRAETIGTDDLPVGIRPRRLASPPPPRHAGGTVEALFARLVVNGESFWACVYPLFMQREITREDIRNLVRRGLQTARGNYAALVKLFNMPSSDQKKFGDFLRKYDCDLAHPKKG